MTRVPPQRPSRPPPAAAQAQRGSRLRRSAEQLEKPKPTKAGEAKGAEEGEGQGWVHEAGEPKEAQAKEAAREAVHEQLAGEHAEKSEAKEAQAELHESAERQEKLKQGQAGKPVQQKQPQQKTGAEALLRKPVKDGFEAGQAKASQLSSASYASLQAVGTVANKLAGTLARADRPPDAFMLLREAKEKGVLFTEDALRDGHSEEHEDPELAAAVEETIRLLFGVKGILRVGAGKNDKNDSIVVVVAGQGFGETALTKVPPKVHRFDTLVAIPFELLPLRRER